MARLAPLAFPRLAHRALGRIAADLVLQLDDVDELIGLAAQLVGDHRRLGRDRRHDNDAHAAPLHRLDQPAEVAVAGEQHHLVDVRRHLHGIDGKLDIHVAFDLASAGLVDELFGRLGDDGVAVIVEPIDQRPDRRIFLILDHRGVVERADQIAARLELAQQALVIDIEAERFGGGVKVGAVNEQGDFLDLCRHGISLDASLVMKPDQPQKFRRSGVSLKLVYRHREHRLSTRPRWQKHGTIAYGVPEFCASTNAGPPARALRHAAADAHKKSRDAATVFRKFG